MPNPPGAGLRRVRANLLVAGQGGSYPGSMGNALRRELRTHGWWIALALASTAAVTVAWGLWLLPVYGLINIGGVWSVCHDLGSKRRGLQIALAIAAILLLPVGLLAPLFTKGGLTPAEKSAGGSGDPDVMRETARGSYARGPIGGQGP